MGWEEGTVFPPLSYSLSTQVGFYPCVFCEDESIFTSFYIPQVKILGEQLGSSENEVSFG